VGLFDFNNDGWKDLFTAGSHVNDRVEAFESAVYQETNRVFVNLHNGTFRDESEQAGLQESKAHRGSSYADFDGDGKVDVVVSSLEGAAEVWQNVSRGAEHWIEIRLVGVKSNRDGMGTRVRIGNQHNQMTSAVSYASSSLGGIHFGLGDVSSVPAIEVVWPSGKRQTMRDVKANQVLTIREPAE
jgi:hypothetical protein